MKLCPWTVTAPLVSLEFPSQAGRHPWQAGRQAGRPAGTHGRLAGRQAGTHGRLAGRQAGWLAPMAGRGFNSAAMEGTTSPDSLIRLSRTEVLSIFGKVTNYACS